MSLFQGLAAGGGGDDWDTVETKRALIDNGYSSRDKNPKIEFRGSGIAIVQANLSEIYSATIDGNQLSDVAMISGRGDETDPETAYYLLPFKESISLGFYKTANASGKYINVTAYYKKEV